MRIMSRYRKGKTFDISAQINQLILLGNHTEQCMRAEAYRATWPTTVVQPVQYAGRLDKPLLVDLMIAPRRIAALNWNMEVYVELASCSDIVAAPRHENGAVLTRYVAWIQTDRWPGRNVADVQNEMPADEVGLVTAEGFHLPGQYEMILRKQAVDILGSRYDEISAPCVGWFGRVHPYLGAYGVRGSRPYPYYGSGSRGITVVPVTW